MIAGRSRSGVACSSSRWQIQRKPGFRFNQHTSTLLLTAWLPLHQIAHKSFSWRSASTAALTRGGKKGKEKKKTHTHGCEHTECLVVLIKQQLSLLFWSRAGIRQRGSLSCGFPVEQNTRASTSANTVRPPSRPFSAQPLRTCCKRCFSMSYQISSILSVPFNRGPLSIHQTDGRDRKMDGGIWPR